MSEFGHIETPEVPPVIRLITIFIDENPPVVTSGFRRNYGTCSPKVPVYVSHPSQSAQGSSFDVIRPSQPRLEGKQSALVY